MDRSERDADFERIKLDYIHSARDQLDRGLVRRILWTILQPAFFLQVNLIDKYVRNHIGGYTKDLTAIQHRLASIEESLRSIRSAETPESEITRRLTSLEQELGQLRSLSRQAAREAPAETPVRSE